MPIQGFPTPAAHLVVAALDAAVARVAQITQGPVPGLGPATTLFAPLSETLMWIVALDNELRAADPTYEQRRDGDHDGQALPGLRFARNRAVHGLVVAAYMHGGAVPGMMQLGNAGLGQAPTHRWRASAELQNVPGELSHAYDAHVSGRGILEVLNPVIAFLRSESGT